MAIPDANKVDVIDLQDDDRDAHSRRWARDPQEVLVRPDGKAAYVSCMGANQVAEIDLATWKVTRTICDRQRDGWIGLGEIMQPSQQSAG